MKKYILTGPALALTCGVAFAAGTKLDCGQSKTGVPYNAEVINDGTMNRSVQVTFARKLSAATATATEIVQACVNAAVQKNAAIDALGSAWVGSKPVNLSKGKYYAYLARNKKYQFM
jgi:hypothetical protein